MKSLQNCFLIATPSLLDPYFKQTVTYICEHDENGAMGLIINQPVDISLDELLGQVEMTDKNKHHPEGIVYSGGPVATDRGFVLHSPQHGWKSSIQVSDEMMVTTSSDILKTLGTADEPNKYLVTLGYSGWTAGQLEKELAENSWLVVEADPQIIFDAPVEERWQSAARSLGVDIWQLSSEVGHA